VDLRPNSIVQIRHIQKNVKYWQGEHLALRYNGRIGVLLEEERKSIWFVALGMKVIRLGSAWLVYLEDTDTSHENGGIIMLPKKALHLGGRCT
jgi:hypothetical protein